MARAAYVVGTFDTKAQELRYVAQLLRTAGLRVVTVDVSTQKPAPDVDVRADAVAAFHPGGSAAVLNVGERGIAVTGMATALSHFIASREDLGGMIGLGGSGGTAIVTAAMRALPIGVPKVMVSTLAAGDVGPYVDIYDITMMFSVTDIAGLNRLSTVVLANGAHALAGMMTRRPPDAVQTKPALGISMFGVTTPCVQQLTARLTGDYDCQVFHATGPGGRAMEALAANGMLQGMVDLTTTEVVDHLFGGVCTAGPGRLDVVATTGIPWVGSCGAFDMVNFWALETVPGKYRGRLLHQHNSNVTLMRTTAAEMEEAAAWMAEKLNRSKGPVRMLLPEGGVSALDAPGQKFHDPAADEALFRAVERHFITTDTHRLLRLPYHINDVEFVDAVERHVREIISAA